MTDGNDAADAEDVPARTACAGESPAPSDILKYAFGGWGRLCERPQHPRALSGLRPLEYPRFSVLIEPRCCDVLSQLLVVLPWPPSCSPKCAASSSTSSLPSVTAHRPLPPAPPRFLESPSFLRHADRFNLILLVFLYTWRDVVFHACQAVCLHLPPVRGDPPRLGAGARLYGLSHCCPTTFQNSVS